MDINIIVLSSSPEDLDFLLQMISKSKFCKIQKTINFILKMVQFVTHSSDACGFINLLNNFKEVFSIQVIRKNIKFSIILPSVFSLPCVEMQKSLSEENGINLTIQELIKVNELTTEIFFSANCDGIKKIDSNHGMLQYLGSWYPVFNLNFKQCVSCGSLAHEYCEKILCFNCGDNCKNVGNCNLRCRICCGDHGLNSRKCQVLYEKLKQMAIDEGIFPGDCYIKTFYIPFASISCRKETFMVVKELLIGTYQMKKVVAYTFLFCHPKKAILRCNLTGSNYAISFDSDASTIDLFFFNTDNPSTVSLQDLGSFWCGAGNIFWSDKSSLDPQSLIGKLLTSGYYFKSSLFSLCSTIKQSNVDHVAKLEVALLKLKIFNYVLISQKNEIQIYVSNLDTHKVSCAMMGQENTE